MICYFQSFETFISKLFWFKSFHSAYQFTDAFWVGRLGGTAVAAVSVHFPITFFMIALGEGWRVAGATLIAQYM